MRKQPKSWQAALLLASVMGLSANAAPVPTSVAAPQAAQRSAGTCTGVVVDENGEPLIGASVRVEGNKMGATADIDGRFTLTGVKPGSKIAISCVGCQPTTVVWNGSPLNVVLRNGDTVLDEVVVMGYGVQQKRAKITNSVSTVSDKALTTGMNANPAQALVGAASGVKVNITSGDPGATPSIVVRGGTDWNGNNAPLVVVDGQVRGSLSDINPNDIADMQILKDAGATALYGARAANGVILIKTKTGTAGNGKVQFSAKYGLTHYSAGYDYADAETYIKYMRVNGYMFANPANNETAGNYDPTKAYRWTDKNGDTHSFFPYAFPTAYSSITGNNTPYGHGRTTFDQNMNWNIMEYVNSDEQNELLKQGWKVMADPLNPYLNGNRQLMYRDTDIVGYNLADKTVSQDYNLSFSGGNDKGNYYASLGYYSADGAVPESFYKRYNFAFTGGYNIMSWLRANSIFNFIRANWLNDGFSGGANASPGFLFARFAACPPTARINNEDGSPLFGYSGYNLKFQDPREVQNQTDKFQMNQSLTATLIPGLTLKGTMNWFYSESWYNGFTRDYIQNQQGAINTNRGTSVSFSRSFEQTYNAVANFVRTFQEKHSVNAMLGAEVLLRDYRDLAASGSKAPTDDFSNLQYAFTGKQSPYEPTTVSASNYYYKDALISYFGRAEYDYMDKYLVAGTLRADGYSRLLNTTDDQWNRWGVFPGVSAGWVFSKEDFWVNNPNLAFINYGKLRGSYGMNGIVNSGVIGYYTLQGSYSAYQYGGVTGFRISGLPNPGLKWERTRTLEGGVDLGFLNNRVNLGLTYYNRITMDKYADKTLAPTTGFSTVKANQGKYGNQGVEIDLQATAINTRDFRWNIGANITFNKNRVVELPYNGLDNNRIGGIEVYEGMGLKDDNGDYKKIWVGGLQEGQEPNHLWGFRKDHMLRTWQDVENMGDYIDVSTDVGNKRLYATQKGLDRLKEMGMANGAIQLTPGDIVWKDVNGDNMIDNFDKWDLGNMTPHWTGGLNTQVSWKGLSLYARTDFSFGYTVYDGAYSWAMGGGQGAFGFMKDIDKTWTPDRPDAELPRYLAGSQLGSNNYLRTSDVLATTGSYLALRELQLSYAIPANICKKFRAQDMSLSITGQNLGYVKKSTLPLPDKVEYTSGNTGGWGGTYTLPVSVIFGLNVSF